MTPMKLTVRRLRDNRELQLENVSELWVRSALDSPAAAMHAVAAVDAAPGELGSVTVRCDGQVLFDGKVDSQQFSLSERGRLLQLDARSRGAALLDNEALPGTLIGPTMTTIFRLFAEPYGFVLYNPCPGGSLGSYTIHKGCCEWDAVCGFVRRVYGRTPHVQGDVLSLNRQQPTAHLVIGGSGVMFTRLEHHFVPYHMLSKVVLRDQDGRYSMAVEGTDAVYYGIKRKRYVITPDEFTDAPGLDANQRIRMGLLQKDTFVAVLPDIVRALPADGVRIADEACPMDGLMVRETLWRQDQNGVTTTLSMIKSLYYD